MIINNSSRIYFSRRRKVSKCINYIPQSLSYNEITSCKIYNNTQFSNSGTFNKEDTRNNNNPKQIIYTFNLDNVSNGNYTLECTNLCGITLILQ